MRRPREGAPEKAPGLKPIFRASLFRWTDVQLPLLKQGAPTGEAGRDFGMRRPREGAPEKAPGLKPIFRAGLFRWTDVQLPLLKQGAPLGTDRAHP